MITEFRYDVSRWGWSVAWWNLRFLLARNIASFLLQTPIQLKDRSGIRGHRS